MNFINLFLEQVNNNPQSTALVGFTSEGSEETLTYQDLMYEVIKSSESMRVSEAQSCVIVRSGNTTDTFILVLASMYSGRTPLVVNPMIPTVGLANYVSNLPFNVTISSSRDSFETTDKKDTVEDLSDTLLLLTSSGTTGSPKLVKYTEKIYSEIMEVCGTEYTYTGKHLVVGPTFVSGVLAGGALPHLAFGGSVEILPKWDAEVLVEKIKLVDSTALVPAHINMLKVSHPDLSPLDNLVVVLGGSRVTAETRRWSLEHLSKHTLAGYGTTEFGWISVVHPEDLDDTADSVGTPMQGVTIELSDIGEIIAVYPKIGTRVNTGDIGYEKDGLLYLTDRVDDLIKVGGRKVYPSEIEVLAKNFPGVQEVVIVAAKHDIMGEVPVAFIVGDADTQALESYLRGVLEPYMVPRTYITVEDLPMSPAGKLLRSALRERV